MCVCSWLGVQDSLPAMFVVLLHPLGVQDSLGIIMLAVSVGKLSEDVPVDG